MYSRKEVLMSERPILDKNLDSKTFRDFYYLKEELDSVYTNKGKCVILVSIGGV